ncbi:MAG: hypothetical protein ACT4QF_18665 [Sporichthyaceae bacterium]
MTRGRHANHAFIAADATEETHHRGRPSSSRKDAGEVEDRAWDVLATALARSGAQDAAHTVRENARVRAAEDARRAAALAVERAAEPVVPDEHASRATELTRRQAERDRCARELQDHREAAARARDELARTTMLRSGRRADLRDAILGHDDATHAAAGQVGWLDQEIKTLSRLVQADGHERVVAAEQRVRAARAAEEARTRDEEPHLAAALPAALVRRPPQLRSELARGVSLEDRCALEQALDRSRRLARDHARDHGRGRDDNPGIGW